MRGTESKQIEEQRLSDVFLITMELYGTVQKDLYGFDTHTVLVSGNIHRWFWSFRAWDLMIVRKEASVSISKIKKKKTPRDIYYSLSFILCYS